MSRFWFFLSIATSLLQGELVDGFGFRPRLFTSPATPVLTSQRRILTTTTTTTTTLWEDTANNNAESDHQLDASSPDTSGSEREEEERKNTMRRPLVRLIDNFWYVMTAPFPDLRKLSRKRDPGSKFVVSLRLRDGLAAVLIYFGIGVLAYHFGFERWSVVDSLYFTAVTFSTVGYGDLYPTTRAGKAFTCGFGLAGIALLGAAVATIGSRLVQAEIEATKLARRQSQKQILQIYDSLPKLLKSVRRGSKRESQKLIAEARKVLAAMHLPRLQFPSGWTTFLRTAQYVMRSIAIISFGGLVIGRLEGWSWFDSIYYSLITASTIGIGDFAPVTKAGRLAAVLVIPMSVAAAGEILASVGLALVERRQKKIFKKQLFRGGLTMDLLRAMDTNDDGRVEREEYVLFMLMEMGLVTKNEIDTLWTQFDRLDVTRTGSLDRQDLVLMAELRDAGLIVDDSATSSSQ